MKIGTFLCSCGNSLNNIDWNELQNFMREKMESGDDFCVFHESLCSHEGKRFLLDTVNREQPEAIVFGGCTPKTAGYLFEQELKQLNISPFQVVGANLREHVSWITPDPKLATSKAKAVVLGSYNRAGFESPVEPKRIEIERTAVIIGAGPAGLQAAQDLAEKGNEVHIIDRNSYIGGNAVKLGAFFPSEDCAACQTSTGVRGVHQTSVRRCFYRSGFDLHPKINLYIRSEPENISGSLGNYSVTIKSNPTYVHMEKCINCDLCSKACPIEKPDEMNLGLTTRKAIYLPNITCSTTKYVVNRDECPEGCTECEKVCPVNAIDLSMQEKSTTISAGGLILATGFQEYNPALVEEYHYGELGYENVITQSELARFLALTGPTRGKLKKKNGDPVNNLVIINCVGSRSLKYNEWCSNICCMIGLKHAIKIKEQSPETDVTCCYIDIRAVGSNYEKFYSKARDLGVKFIRGRPAEVETDGTYLYVHAEDSQADEIVTIKADVVTLSMSMVASEGVQELADQIKVKTDETGYFRGLYSKFRLAETNQAGIFVAGTAVSPADIPTTITRAAHAASHLDLVLSKGMVDKRFPIAEIDNNKCTLCEICVTACPFGAIEIIPVANPGIKLQVNQQTCIGCGQCVSSCPASCIDIDYYQEEQILSQVEGLLYDNGHTEDPIIITFSCWECAYASTDYIGQASLTDPYFVYPHNVRIVPVQCTGNVSARLIQKTFELGAGGIIVLGCYEDKCHYETGSKASSIRVHLLKKMLEFSGIDPNRLEKETAYCESANRFVETANKMANKLKVIGKLER
jgi:heterodisulfide reductase subunit A-like polyferredoxin/coenzyme F420-reducing hydrogenase delta subunit